MESQSFLNSLSPPSIWSVVSDLTPSPPSPHRGSHSTVSAGHPRPCTAASIIKTSGRRQTIDVPLTRAARCLVGAAPAAQKVAGYNPPLCPPQPNCPSAIAPARGVAASLMVVGIARSCIDGPLIAGRWSLCGQTGGRLLFRHLL